MKPRKFLCLGGALILAVVLLFAIQKAMEPSGPQEISIPDDAMFVGAPSAEGCEELTILLTFDDSFDPVESEGTESQKLRWELMITPKEGVSAEDFYCTLLLNDWVLEQSDSPSLDHMGVGKGFVGNMPEDSKGFQSSIEKFIPLSLLGQPSYQEAVEAPVKLMVGYDGQERYYWVTPTQK